MALDPSPDLETLRRIHGKIALMVLERAEAEALEIELATDERPSHLVLQLLASAALTSRSPTTQRAITFGPRAAAEIARMDFDMEKQP